jgi:hypothetical protein
LSRSKPCAEMVQGGQRFIYGFTFVGNAYTRSAKVWNAHPPPREASAFTLCAAADKTVDEMCASPTKTVSLIKNPRTCVIIIYNIFGGTMFLPTTKDEMQKLGWQQCDVILVTGDAYIDSPYVGAAVAGHVLMDAGYKVGIIAQPHMIADSGLRTAESKQDSNSEIRNFRAKR